MDADSVLDRLSLTGAVHKGSVHVVDSAFAVAAQAKRVGHIATAVLTQVESVLSLVGVFWISVGYNHFCE